MTADEGASAPTVSSPTGEGEYSPGESALLVDAMLGTLATYLRMCGYDAADAPSDRDAAEGGDRDTLLRRRARRESRTILTRDRSLAASAEATVLLEGRTNEAQLRELSRAGFALRLPSSPERCGTCNAELATVPPTEPTPAYAPAAEDTAVYRCVACGQHFWQGSHWDDVAATLATVR